VIVTGIKGFPPPSTIKATIATRGGFQCETTFYINSLVVDKKDKMKKKQLVYLFKYCNFSKLCIKLCGAAAVDPKSQQAGTILFGIFPQARRR
jgi:hypothetical protein